MAQQAHILVVDDEPAVQFTLTHLLQRHGYRVTTATDGQEALDQIQRQVFHLLLLDLIMPGINGVELAQQARALQPAAGILILTGSQPLGVEPEHSLFDGIEHVFKSASPQEILGRIQAALNRSMGATVGPSPSG